MAADQALADGLTQNATKIGTLIVGSQPYQAADVAKVLQARITAVKAGDRGRGRPSWSGGSRQDPAREQSRADQGGEAGAASHVQQ